MKGENSSYALTVGEETLVRRKKRVHYSVLGKLATNPPFFSKKKEKERVGAESPEN